MGKEVVLSSLDLQATGITVFYFNAHMYAKSERALQELCQPTQALQALQELRHRPLKLLQLARIAPKPHHLQ